MEEHRNDESAKQRTLQEPRQLLRDTLWSSDYAGELEFVVDNQAVAALANIESRIANDFYRPAIERIRLGLHALFTGRFCYKGGH